MGHEWDAKPRRGPRRRPLAERLWAKVNKDGPTMPGMESPCWEWEGLKNGDGYGQISLGGHCGRMIGAHRAAWIVTHGEVPEGKEVCHRCDHRPCCRPDHLFPGTHRENIDDATEKGRMGGPAGVSKNRGATNGNAKLSPAAVADIRARFKVAATAAQLAAEHGVSRGTVYAIGQGRIWRDAA